MFCGVCNENFPDDYIYCPYCQECLLNEEEEREWIEDVKTDYLIKISRGLY